MKILVRDPLDFHPAQAPQFRQQFFRQKTARQKNDVVMNPAAFVEFDFDAIRRIYDVSLALVFDAVPELKEHFPQPLAAVLKSGFLIRIKLWVQRERQKQLAAHIRQPVPNSCQHFVNAHRMEP